jgi:hypothetical protein
VKWRNWKIVFYDEQRDWWTPRLKLREPKAFDLITDPKEISGEGHPQHLGCGPGPLSGLAIGPNGTPTSNDVGQAFHGVLILGNGKLTVKPFGLVGHQSLGFTWNNENRFSLDQDPSNVAHLLLNEQFPLLANPGPVLTQILASRFPNLLVPTQPANRAGSSWTISYSFDQYLW